MPAQASGGTNYDDQGVTGRSVAAETGRLLVTAEVLHIGRTIATAQGHLVSEGTGKLVAHAKATLMIMRPE